MTENLPLMQLLPLKHTTTKKTNKQTPQNPVVMSGDDNTVSEQWYWWSHMIITTNFKFISSKLTHHFRYARQKANSCFEGNVQRFALEDASLYPPVQTK